MLLAFLVGLYALVPYVALQYRRFGRIGWWPGLMSAATLLYVCALFGFTLFPLPDVTSGFCEAHARLQSPQLRPFAWLEYPGRADVMVAAFNVLLFLPLGMLLRYRYGRSLPAVAGIGLLVSLAIESTQFTGDWWAYPCPYRQGDVDDLIQNTTGAVLGGLLAIPLSRVLPAAWPDRRPDLDRPGPGRRIAGDLLDLVLWVVTSLTLVVLVAAVGAAAGRELPEGSPWETALPVLVTALVGAVFFLVVPALRADRSTPGRAATHLALARADGEGPVTAGVAATRSLLLYGPVGLTFFLGPQWATPALLLLYLGFVLARRDRRSLHGLLSGTDTVTRESAERAGGREHERV